MYLHNLQEECEKTFFTPVGLILVPITLAANQVMGAWPIFSP